MASNNKSAFADKKMLGRAIKDSFVKLNPKTQVQNPVCFWYIFRRSSQADCGLYPYSD